MKDIDDRVIEAFGEQWSRLDQSRLSGAEFDSMARSYFAVFPWHALPPDAEGYDLGCGSGRWARYVAPRVGILHCIEPSSAALDVARRNLEEHSNVRFHLSGAENMPLADDSQDFGYTLGVLHHVSNTEAALRNAVSKLKPGAPLLVYLYYSFDNRPRWYRSLWRCSEVLRYVIARAPGGVRFAVAQVIALTVYLPLSRAARLAERLGADVSNFPLAAYRDRSVYGLRTDALDRFGTRLEKRFSRAEIGSMMNRAGLRDVTFSEDVPYWCAVGYRAGA